MYYRTARKLKKDDIVVIKETGEVVEIISSSWDHNSVWFECMTQNGQIKIHHSKVDKPKSKMKKANLK